MCRYCSILKSDIHKYSSKYRLTLRDHSNKNEKWLQQLNRFGETLFRRNDFSRQLFVRWSIICNWSPKNWNWNKVGVEIPFFEPIKLNGNCKKNFQHILVTEWKSLDTNTECDKKWWKSVHCETVNSFRVSSEMDLPNDALTKPFCCGSHNATNACTQVQTRIWGKNVRTFLISIEA